MENGIWCEDNKFYVIKPMRYHNKLKKEKVEEAMKNGEWLIQEKKDGTFSQLMKNDNGDIALFSRTISKKNNEYVNKIDNVPHIKEWAENNLPNGTTLLGELYVVGGKSNNATSIMGALPDKAIERQFNSDKYGGPIHFYAFDCIKYKNEDIINLTAEERIGIYLDKFNEYQNEYFEVSKSYTLFNTNSFIAVDSFEPIISNVFDNGGEGVVFKNLSMPYEPDKRPIKTSFKLKEHIDSVDLVVIDLLEPEERYTGKELLSWPYWKELNLICNDDGDLVEEYVNINVNHVNQKMFIDINEKHGPDCYIPITKAYYYGWKNAMLIGAYDDDKLIEIGRVASGITDEMREDMSINPDNYIGKVAECGCMSLDKDSKTLRHPVFLRIRDDKNPQECLVKEIF